MGLNWFYSRTVRRAGHMRKHVGKLVAAQTDILPPDKIQKIQAAIDDLNHRVCNSGKKKDVLDGMQKLADTANANLKHYPFPAWRENVEVLLVAIAVAMAIRTFFVQPFKIPTGSMQPTLFGITSNPDRSRNLAFDDSGPEPDFEVPNPVSRFLHFWWSGVSFTHVVAKADGQLREFEEAKRFLLFNLKQRFQIGSESYTVWFPPDNMLKRAGLLNVYGQPSPRVFKAGEDIIKLKAISGDHLFVDRMTYNFRRPSRGEIIVFETRGIMELPQDQFYIKRLVALGPERVQLGNDRHLILDGKRLPTDTPHFEKVYSFPPDRPPTDSVFSGHLNDTVARQYGMGNLAPLFRTESDAFEVKPDHYMVMGDNTVNSSDSRSWGDFPQKNVIGKSFLVYWPFGSQDGRGSRWGWGTR